MRVRLKELGTSNLIGANVQKIRKQRGIKQKDLLAKLQVNGIDMSASALSKLEGQVRMVTDIELVTLSKILALPIEELLDTK